ncbi:hypothetical protein GB931_05550 [Modestobacter sp. I12A-02628]|uniref:DUF4175 domain-containing protein n=1 Tax=Goekera deserti TaxID=2497753 RepID=A0A7K3WCS3_9ACTN|nr:hypothetical protein [Goekera deserti]MPQ97398.1 hypothetical protein [Goekera deserti]NDI48001.1 hypothetical protein [Goekera deserti]NEL53749.1 DUF4175 domain-containing protein [Goekera deserti]
MTAPLPGDAVLVSPSARRRLPTLGVLALFLGAYLLLGAAGLVEPWLVWAGVIVFGTILLVGLAGSVRARGAPAGRGRRHGARRWHDPWSDVAEVRVTGLQPRWLFVVSLGYRVVAVVGRPGVQLPALPSASPGRCLRASARLQDRWYGTRLVVMPYAFDTSTDALLAAVRRFSDVPVVSG